MANYGHYKKPSGAKTFDGGDNWEDYKANFERRGRSVLPTTTRVQTLGCCHWCTTSSVPRVPQVSPPGVVKNQAKVDIRAEEIANWDELDIIARHAIAYTLTDQKNAVMRNAKTAKAAWDILKAGAEGRPGGSATQALYSLIDMRQEHFKCMMDYI